MSLAARITVGPSRLLGLFAAGMAVVGALVAASTVAARWPAAGPWAWIAAVVVACGAASAGDRRNRRSRCTISVSDRPGIDVERDDDEADVGPWRLAAPTLAWPGFCLLALERDDGGGPGRSMRVGIFDFELASADRRSLRRFLTWSLRGAAAGRARLPR